MLVILTTCTLILVGIAMLAWPRRFWYLTHGWWAYDNPTQVQLSNAYLFWNGAYAVIVILTGVIGFYLYLFQEW